MTACRNKIRLFRAYFSQRIWINHGFEIVNCWEFGPRSLPKITFGMNPHIVCWEPECCSTMFRWEPGRYFYHRLCTAIVPFWFSSELLWTALLPFWFSTKQLWTALLPFWFSTKYLWTALLPFRFSTEHLWTTLTPFWLSTDDMKVFFLDHLHLQ